MGLTNKDAKTKEIHEKYKAIQANPRVSFEVRRAYEILLDSNKKSEYDKNLQEYEEQIKHTTFYNMLLMSARLGKKGYGAFILETYLFDKPFNFAAFEKQFSQSSVVPLSQNQIEFFLKEVFSSYCNPLLKIKIFNSVKKLRPKLDWSPKRYLSSNVSVNDNFQDLNQLTTQIYLGFVLLQADQLEKFKKLECKNIEECWELWLDIPEDSDSIDYLKSIFDILISSRIEFTEKNVKDCFFLRKDPLIQHFNLMMAYARQKEKFSVAALSDIVKQAYLASDRPHMQGVLRKLVLDFPEVDYAQILKGISRDVWTFKGDSHPTASRPIAYRSVPDQGKKFRNLPEEIKLLDPINENLIITDVAKTLKKPNPDIEPLIDFNFREPDDQSDEQIDMGIDSNEHDDVSDQPVQQVATQHPVEVLELFVEQFAQPNPITVDEDTVSDIELINPEISKQTAESLLALDLNETLTTDEFPHVSAELCSLYAKGKTESLHDLLEEIARSNPRSLKNFRDQLISGLKTLEDIDWIDIAMDIFLKKPSNPTRLNALVETIKIFYRAGLKFTDQHLDKIASHENLFATFCKSFGFEASMICLELLRDDLLASPEIHLALENSVKSRPSDALEFLLRSTMDAKSIHASRLLLAMLSCEGSVYAQRNASIKPCYEFIRDFGADVSLFIAMFKRLIIENKFTSKHISLWNVFYAAEKEKLKSLQHEVIFITSGIMDLQISELICNSKIDFNFLTLPLLNHAHKGKQTESGIDFFNLLLTQLNSYAGSQESLKVMKEFLTKLPLTEFVEGNVFCGLSHALQIAMKKFDVPAPQVVSSQSSSSSLAKGKSKAERVEESQKLDQPRKKARLKPKSKAATPTAFAATPSVSNALPGPVPEPTPQTEVAAPKPKKKKYKKREKWSDFKEFKFVETPQRKGQPKPKKGSAAVTSKLNTSEYTVRNMPPIVQEAIRGVSSGNFFKSVAQPKPRQESQSFIPAAAKGLSPIPRGPVIEKPDQSQVTMQATQQTAFFQKPPAPVENPPPSSPSKRQGTDVARQPLQDGTNRMRIDFLTM